MSATSFRTLTLPAGSALSPGIVTEQVSGRFYATVSTTGLFYVQANQGAQIEQNQGRRFGTPESKEFSKLSFFNYTASAVTLTYYAGATEYVPDPSVIATINTVNVNVSSQAASTYTKGSGIQTLTAGNSNTYTGLDGVKVRKQIVIHNRATSTGVLDIKDGSGTLMYSLAIGASPFTLETNGTIQVTANGGTCDYTIAATFFS
jgi:hypothetical protein